MLVTKRAKPEAYDTPEDKELFGQAIEAVNAAADRAEKAGKTAQEAATKTGQDAEQTAQDRVEVAKMVETVTDISEQVKKVEDLSNKAQAAATKTEADAQQTAEDRVEVGKMLETVKDVSEQVKTVEESVRKAKESEQAAAGHRTAVEEMKNSVEQTASTFPQTVQSGIRAVENAGASEVREITKAGTSQKAAVEAAGTQAVESVENVKASATEAVETVKTEAIQAVQEEGTTQTGNVTTEGAKQVKAVQDKGNEVLQSIPEDFQMQMESKLDKQQGVENKGKALVIGEDGNVAPGEVQSGGGDGIAIINTMSGESPLVIPDSAERVNKRLELGGKTEQAQEPSPSPEYPQEIKNSGKWNEETQKYEVDVKITNAEQNWSKEQTLTLTSDRPITKWDKLVEQGGQIGWLYESAINEYRGDTIVAIYENGFYFLLNNKKLKSGEGYCEELKQYVSREEKPCINFNASQNTYAYTLNTQAIYGSTVSAIKEYLKTHPLHLAYKTETTEFVPLPQSEQNAIRALKTYYPTTVITADGGELDPDIKATYTADTKNYIDNKVSAKVASIIRQYRLNTANLLSLMPMETQAAMIENDTNNILENAEEMKHE